MAYLPLQNALLGRLGRYSAVKNAPGSRPCGRLPPAQERKPQTKLPHLEVSADGTVTEAALGIFKQQLTSYKQHSGITSDDPDTVLQSLPPAAYSLLFARLGDDLIAQTEERLIASIQASMVRPENKLVHVIKLQRMKQDSGQTIAHFSANIRAAARQCQFRMSCKCTKRVSYEEHMVLYQLLSGLEDAEVQADLLAKTNLTLEKYAMNREMARRSQINVHEEHGKVGRLRSSYKKQKSAVTGVTPAAELCRHCGEHAHQNRRLECKAYIHICSCGQRGLSQMCASIKVCPGASPLKSRR